MATYNGLSYLGPQLKSILEQLGPADELVVVDDASGDGTPEWLSLLNDGRISVWRNPRNLGPVRSFERALSLAHGDVVFFADQDDIWLPGKVESMVAALRRFDKAAVVSDAIVIDGQGHHLFPSFFAHRSSGPGLLKNFARNTYLGCCMAINSKMKTVLLPFPLGVVQHDEWIGLASEIVGGVGFLPRPLLLYRRHGSNTSSMSRFKLSTILFNRLRMLRAVLTRAPQLIKARRGWRAQ